MTTIGKTIILTKLLLVTIITFTACTHRKETISHEKGFVVEKQYVPEFDGSGSSFNTKGDFGIHTVHDKEKYIIVFKCEHGVVFSMNKPEIFAKLNKGDTVQIDFYELINDEGEVKDFDFIDANPTNNK